MARLLVDDLVLVLLSPDTARPVVDGQRLAPALAGALLMDLALAGRLDVAEGARRSGDRLAVLPGPPTGDALLDDAVTRFGPDRRRARAAVQRISRRRLPREVLERLAGDGLVEHTPGGFLRFARNVPDPSVRKQLVADLTGVVTGTAAPGERRTALLSLVQAVGAVPKVVSVPGTTRRELNRRAKEISEAEWAGAAVLAAVRATRAGTTAAVTAAVAAGAAAASG